MSKSDVFGGLFVGLILTIIMPVIFIMYVLKFPVVVLRAVDDSVNEYKGEK